METPMTHYSWPRMSRPPCWEVIFTYMHILNVAYCHLCGLFVQGRVKIWKILEQIAAIAWEVSMQPAIFESREQTLVYIITNEPIDIVDVLHPHPALGARQPRWWDGNSRANYAHLSVSAQLTELEQLRRHMPAVFRTLALAALDKVKHSP